MKNKSSSVLNIMIILGVLFLITVIVLSLIIRDPSESKMFNLLFLVVQICFGAIIINNTIILTHKGFHLFMGLLFSGWGLMFLLLETGVPFTLLQCWPVFTVVSGIFLIISGLYKYKSIKIGYLMPSIVLICMGAWYSLFSFKIIKVPFITVAKIAGPIFLLIVALTLVLFFMLQQKHKEFVITDEEGDFSDEEIILSDE